MAKKRKAAESVGSTTGTADAADTADTAGIAQYRVVGVGDAKNTRVDFEYMVSRCWD